MCACEYTESAQPQDPRAGCGALARQFLLLAGVDGRFTFQTKELWEMTNNVVVVVEKRAPKSFKILNDSKIKMIFLLIFCLSLCSSLNAQLLDYDYNYAYDYGKYGYLDVIPLS